MVVFLLRIDRDTNYNFILLIIEKLIIIFYLLFLLW
ncbi:putative membrane protein, partial [Acinetobacter baumannii 1465485]